MIAKYLQVHVLQTFLWAILVNGQYMNRDTVSNSELSETNDGHGHWLQNVQLTSFFQQFLKKEHQSEISIVLIVL